jgi:hypothetical protein
MTSKNPNSLRLQVIKILLQHPDFGLEEGNEELRRTLRKVIVDADDFRRAHGFRRERKQTITATDIEHSLALQIKRFEVLHKEVLSGGMCRIAWS